jgi:hypothetical protein
VEIIGKHIATAVVGKHRLWLFSLRNDDGFVFQASHRNTWASGLSSPFRESGLFAPPQ